MVSRKDWFTALANAKSEWREQIGFISKRDGCEIDFTNLVNVIVAEVFLRTKMLDVDYILSQREFTSKTTGKKLFTSFWVGYVSQLIQNKDVPESFTFVDVGTGELKYFKINRTGMAGPAMDILGVLMEKSLSNFLNRRQ